jgi:hypothetical protein
MSVSPEVEELARVQSWLQHAVSHPQENSVAPHEPDETVLRPSPGMSAAAGLDIYRRNYSRRFASFMATMHPALRHALTESVFDDAVADYLCRHEPRGHHVSQLDESLAGYLAAEWPGRGAVSARMGMPLDFVVDLARLERMFHQIYDGPGNEGEDHDAREAQELADRRSDTVLRPAPSFRLFASRFPVGAYLSAVRRGERPPPPATAVTFLALNRRAFAVTIRELDQEQFAILKVLVGGARVGDALRTVAPDRARRWLAHWVEEGFFQHSGHQCSDAAGTVPAKAVEEKT